MLMSRSELTFLAEQWEFHLRARNLSRQTITSYLEATRLLDASLTAARVDEIADVTQRDIEKFRVLEPFAWTGERLAEPAALFPAVEFVGIEIEPECRTSRSSRLDRVRARRSRTVMPPVPKRDPERDRTRRQLSPAVPRERAFRL